MGGEPRMSDAAKNFFISYSRTGDAESGLAHFIRDELIRENHRVFLDVVDIPPGTDWGKEIDSRIGQWCDYFIVLLSERSVHSEMVQAEVRRAHDRRKSAGTPLIVPVRIKYDGSLGYELDSYLSPIQYALWNGPNNSQRLLNILLGLAKDNLAASSQLRAQQNNGPAAPLQQGRPLPAADPRVVKAPGGTLGPNDPFYVRRPTDTVVEQRAAVVGDTVVIKAPRQMGKSSLLVRYLMACRENKKRPCFIDFQDFSNDDLKDYMTFLTRLYSAIIRYLELEAKDEVRFRNQQQFSNYVDDYVLGKINNPVTIASDEADRIIGRPYQTDFFSLLRSWHNKRSDPNTNWEKVDLAIVIATEPVLLISPDLQSPFNVTVSIDLTPFTREELELLNQRYVVPLSPSSLDRMFALIAGHPYLTRLAFYRLTAGPALSPESLFAKAANSNGPFGDHLRSRLFLLQRQPDRLSCIVSEHTCGIFKTFIGPDVAETSADRQGLAQLLSGRRCWKREQRAA